jgi:hypothetical protein
MFDLPDTTTVAVGLATKPYPAFRLPGFNRYSVAYHSTGDKSHNYPFTAAPFGPKLKEGDVLGVGYRPRTGTIFFTRNGRKMDDAFIGLSRWNLFPTIGGDGPCSVHVNLGQAGFVFIEANVKKWGLAPSVGTLAPPPAYGSERGSILLDVGRGARSTPEGGAPGSISPTSRRPHRTRRPKHPTAGGGASSPLGAYSMVPEPLTPPPPITPIDEELDEGTAGPSTNRRYISPTDLPFHTPPHINIPSSPGESVTGGESDGQDASVSSNSSLLSRSPSPEAVAGARNPFSALRRQRDSLTHFAVSLSDSGPHLRVQVHPPPDSPSTPNPPTPNYRDIHLQALTRPNTNSIRSNSNVPIERLPHPAVASLSRREPPAYSPLDAYTYSEGVHIDLPAEFIAAALEGSTPPASAVGQGNSSAQSDRRRTRRR